jgi:UDP-N-acetylglucosamine--N-acetylmuramyl-(pentapeptide) pyrophosphoryl-undecaprenol N-acetylglucosamine transferase
LEKDLDGELLHKKINDTIKNKSKLKEMSKNAGMVGVRDAAEKIYSLVMDIV